MSRVPWNVYSAVNEPRPSERELDRIFSESLRRYAQPWPPRVQPAWTGVCPPIGAGQR